MKILYGVNKKVFPENIIIAIKPDDFIFTAAELNEDNFKIVKIDISEEEAADILNDKNGIISEDGSKIIKKKIEKGKSQYELYVKQMEDMKVKYKINMEIPVKKDIKTFLIEKKRSIIIDIIKKEIVK